MMIKKTLLIIAIISTINLVVAKVEQESWLSIAFDITRDGDLNDKGEFNAAVEAMKNISDDRPARKVAKEISDKWTQSSNEDIKKEAAYSVLSTLPRYPKMDPETVHEQTRILLRKKDINNLIKQSGVDINVPAA